MSNRCKYPIEVWPWYLRWTIGVVIFFGAIVPVAVIGASLEAIDDGVRAFRRSEAWRLISVSVAAIVFGERK